MSLPRPRQPGSHLRVLLGIWILAAAALAPRALDGWIPGDEGLLGQTAERVLAGELPHLDFDDTYTGALAFLHALAFRVLGLELTSIRWLLLAATLVFLPLVYRLAARRSPPLVAGAVTLMCLVWSVPSYFTGMPSWYNLFLATGGTLALVRHVEDGRRRWLFAAGLCGGASLVIKSAGLLYIAAVLLFLVYREQALDEDNPPAPAGRLLYPTFVTAGLGAFLAVLIGFISGRPGAMEVLLYVVPGLVLCAFLLWGVWRRPGSGFAARLRRLLGLALPFLAGVLPPVLLFLVPYALRSGLGELLTASFLFPEKRLQYGVHALPGPATAICALPLLVLLGWPLVRPSPGSLERWLLPPAALGAALLLAQGSNLYAYQTVWFSLRPLVPALAAAGCLTLARGQLRRDLAGDRRQTLFLLLAMVSMTGIVQFPYAWGVYFCYFAPLLILAWLYLADAQPGAPRRLHLAAAGFYFLFGLLWVDLGWVETHGRQFTHQRHDTLLELDRGGLRVTAEKAELYRRLVAEIRRRAPEDAAIYATPDCPEVYFLAARRNPTPTFADFFEDDYGTAERDGRLLRLLDDQRVDVVVLHWTPAFSRLSRGFAATVFERYPNRLPLYPFTVHWRDRPSDVKKE